jgi:hypothetical protein
VDDADGVVDVRVLLRREMALQDVRRVHDRRERVADLVCDAAGQLTEHREALFANEVLLRLGELDGALADAALELVVRHPQRFFGELPLGDVAGDARGADDLAAIADDRGLDRLDPVRATVRVDEGLLDAFVESAAHDVFVVGAVTLGELARPEIEIGQPDALLDAAFTGGFDERLVHELEAAVLVLQPSHVRDVVEDRLLLSFAFANGDLASSPKRVVAEDACGAALSAACIAQRTRRAEEVHALGKARVPDEDLGIPRVVAVNRTHERELIPGHRRLLVGHEDAVLFRPARRIVGERLQPEELLGRGVPVDEPLAFVDDDDAVDDGAERVHRPRPLVERRRATRRRHRPRGAVSDRRVRHISILARIFPRQPSVDEHEICHDQRHPGEPPHQCDLHGIRVGGE